VQPCLRVVSGPPDLMLRCTLELQRHTQKHQLGTNILWRMGHWHSGVIGILCHHGQVTWSLTRILLCNITTLEKKTSTSPSPLCGSTSPSAPSLVPPLSLLLLPSPSDTPGEHGGVERLLRGRCDPLMELSVARCCLVAVAPTGSGLADTFPSLSLALFCPLHALLPGVCLAGHEGCSHALIGIL
jgi:hypothetical protein